MKLNATQLQPLLADLPQWTHHDERGGILKRETEIAPMALRPHPYEFYLYYDI